MPQPDSDSAGEADPPLDVAAWHLQILLTSVGCFDGKIMFLTALNVAGMSAMIGILIAAEPTAWLVGLGFADLSVCVALGLGALWSANLQQFPSPDQLLSTAREVGDRPQESARQHFASIRDATDVADAQLQFRIRTMRTLLVSTPLALIVTIATALTSVS